MICLGLGTKKLANSPQTSHWSLLIKFSVAIHILLQIYIGVESLHGNEETKPLFVANSTDFCKFLIYINVRADAVLLVTSGQGNYWG